MHASMQNEQLLASTHPTPKTAEPPHFSYPFQRTWVMVLMLPSAALYSTVGPSSPSSFTTGCCFTRSKARLASRCLRAVAESRGGARVTRCGSGGWY